MGMGYWLPSDEVAKDHYYLVIQLFVAGNLWVPICRVCRLLIATSI